MCGRGILTSDANIAIYTVFLSAQRARRPVLPPLPCARAAAAAPIIAVPEPDDMMDQGAPRAVRECDKHTVV